MTYKEFKEIMEKSGNFEIRNLGMDIVVAMKNDGMQPVCFIDNIRVDDVMKLIGSTSDMNSTELKAFLEFVLTPIKGRELDDI